ncbi:MAG: IMP cyclohydrolase [Fibromonadaceae bacterium]|jgi:IMP cyclohydrolase|nr:IMP cyclohydrolase [Fibromonadaceae bacterium]
MQNGVEWLKNNDYPGRGIVMGLSPKGERVQVYWIMGRSENSKNRIFIKNQDGSVNTKAFDEKKLTDPSLIIYSPLKNSAGASIVSNGNQTDTIAEFLSKGKTAEDALKTRTYEPDAPNYTPRISGVFYPNGSYLLSILKASCKESPKREAIFIEKEFCEAGSGEILTTYEGSKDPLISFIGLPKKMPIKSSAQETLEFYWNMLNPEYRVSILVNCVANNGESLTIIENANK